ncbi:MAG: copper amine oxidase N-terminal domain-containing protein [Bacillota bacterium]
MKKHWIAAMAALALLLAAVAPMASAAGQGKGKGAEKAQVPTEVTAEQFDDCVTQPDVTAEVYGEECPKMSREERMAWVAQKKEEARAHARSARANGEKGAYLVYVNGERLNLTPMARGGRTLVPFRHLAEFLGATVEWEPSTRTVTMTKGDQTVVLTIGESTALVNGQEVQLDVSADIFEGRTFVPLRFIAEALGADVDYDPETGAITVITLP